MVFPAHQVTGGLVLLAELSDEQLDTLYATERYIERPGERPDLSALRKDLGDHTGLDARRWMGEPTHGAGTGWASCPTR